MINFNSPLSSIGSTSSITLPKVNAAVTQKQNEGSSNASASSSASLFGPAARVDISEQATRMKPARFSVSPDRKYDVLTEVRKSVAARTGTANDATKPNDAAKTDEKTEAKSSKPVRFAVDPSRKFDVLEEVKKSVAAREAAANEAAKKAASAS
ncbi:MAG: hypothetical protein FWC15_07205 [Fibromonadales bacterium]|nr:hypothetical protein [Fibromonadales bacterium]